LAPEDVLAFWFGEPATDPPSLMAKMKRWFAGGPAFDEEIKARFLPEIEKAMAGGLGEWTETVRGKLAVVLLLDQLTRSVYRNDARMYAGDARAQELALGVIQQGLHHELGMFEQMFLHMPLAHAEDRGLQEISVAEAARVAGLALEWQRPMMAMGIEQTRKYRDIIERFGRFPHRNAILGRESTPEETEFLVDWAAKMPPAAMRG